MATNWKALEREDEMSARTDWEDGVAGTLRNLLDRNHAGVSVGCITSLMNGKRRAYLRALL